jgi:hypothetical protein
MRHISISEARKIAREAWIDSPIPRFYLENESAISLSRRVYDSDGTVRSLREYLGRQVDDFGHGLVHCELVALDAGALVSIELGQEGQEAAAYVAVAQTAGLLHDIRRKEKNHAERSAEEAERLLEGHGVADPNRSMIVHAIKNHEAFREEIPIDDRMGRLVSDALYDADKFRWGPDNFITTLWDMLEYARIDVAGMLASYRKGIEGVRRIKTTFRTETGKRYGPEIIDVGLLIGEAIYRRLMELTGGDE